MNVGHTLSQKRPLSHTPFHEHQTKRACDVETPEAIRVRSADLHSSSQDSYKDAGTLLHLQTLINRSNVHNKPSKNVNAAEDFIQVSLVTYPWLVALLFWSC